MISNRAFIAAICVFATIVWAHHRLTSTHRIPTDTIADTSMMRDAAACLVFDDALLLERYADYRKHYQALIDGSEGVGPFIQSFAMGESSRSIAINKSLACRIRYPQLLYPKSDPLVIAVTEYSETLDALREKRLMPRRSTINHAPISSLPGSWMQILPKGYNNCSSAVLPFENASRNLNFWHAANNSRPLTIALATISTGTRSTS